MLEYIIYIYILYYWSTLLATNVVVYELVLVIYIYIIRSYNITSIMNITTLE